MLFACYNFDVDSQNSTSDISLETIKKRTASGLVILTVRTFVLQAITFVSFAVYTGIFKTPEYGTYAIILVVKNFLAYFSDIGLAGALIQKKNDVTKEDLGTTFAVQQTLVIAILVIFFAATPLFRDYFKLTQEGVWLLWAIGVSLFLSSLKTIPTVLMERKLEFSKLVIPQMADVIVLNGSIILLAVAGWGVTSFTIAVLAQGIVGLVITYFLQPWKPHFSFSKDSLKGMLKFGLPYQINTFIALVKDDGLSLVLGGILGTGNFALFDWARKWGQAPLRFFMDQVIKVTFPAFSRIQDQKQELENMVSRSIFFICFLVFPSIIGLIILAPLIIEVIPRYEQWRPALFALGAFGASALFAAITTPLTNLLNAIGKIKITSYLMIMWTVLSWAFIPYLAVNFGVNGAALGYSLVSGSSVIAIFIVRKYIKFGLVTPIFKPLVAAISMGIALTLVKHLMPANLQWIFILVIFGTIVYVLSIILLVGQSILSDFRKTANAILKR